MRALHIATDFPFIKDGKVCNEGGLGVCVTQLIDGLKDSGWEIDILTRKTDDIDGEIYPGYVYRTGYIAPTSSRDWKLTHSFTLIPKLISLLMKTDYDIVHIHNPPAALFAAPIARLFGKSVIMTMHGPWSRVRDRFKLLALFVEIESMEFPNMITFDSNALLKEYGVFDNHIAICNAVDTSKFVKTDKSMARKFLNLPDDDVLVLYAGRSVYGKRMGNIVDLAKLLPHHKIVIAGNEITGSDNIINLGVLSNDYMPMVYSACDCLVLDSMAEGMSRAALEALSCECPVILSDITSNAEITIGYHCGRLFSSTEEAASIIGGLSRAEFEEMGYDGRLRVQGSFNVKRRISAFLECYSGLVLSK